jgi:hypothetical protein
MADTPATQSSTMPYIIAIVMLVLIGTIFIGGVLYLRPALDPLILITAVFGFLVPTFAGVAAFMKSQETHLTVNSQLTAWKAEFKALSHAEGVIAGVTGEQERIAEQKRVLALTAVVSVPAGTTIEPVPVTVISPSPLPVEVKAKPT